MAEELESVLGSLRAEPIVDKNGIMTTRFAQVVTSLSTNSVTTETVIDQQVQTFEGLAAVNTAQLSEQQKLIEENQQLSEGNLYLSSELHELKKRLADLESLID